MRLRRLEPVLRRALSGPCALPRGSRVLVAVSGGADSTALLLGLHRVAHEFGLSLHAAHLHHGLRGEAADSDLAFVQALCARLGVPLAAARWNTRLRMRRRGLSGQAGLRALRREFLRAAARRARAAAIATAHTADDQLETVLMRLWRGAGLRGLGGMAPRRGTWLKPMLEATRADVEADLEAAGERWREDASIRTSTTPATASATGRCRPLPPRLPRPGRTPGGRGRRWRCGWPAAPGRPARRGARSKAGRGGSSRDPAASKQGRLRLIRGGFVPTLLRCNALSCATSGPTLPALQRGSHPATSKT